MGPYRTAYDKPAYKKLKSLSQKLQDEIDDAVLELSYEPRPDGCTKLEGYDGLYRIPVGEYRVIYVIEEEEVMVLIVKIGPRKEVYKKRK